MKTICGLLAGALALAACAPGGTTTPAPPESAGAAGEAYCEGPPPIDPVAMEAWNETCFPDRR